MKKRSFLLVGFYFIFGLVYSVRSWGNQYVYEFENGTRVLIGTPSPAGAPAESSGEENKNGNSDPKVSYSYISKSKTEPLLMTLGESERDLLGQEKAFLIDQAPVTGILIFGKRSRLNGGEDVNASVLVTENFQFDLQGKPEVLVLCQRYTNGVYFQVITEDGLVYRSLVFDRTGLVANPNVQLDDIVRDIRLSGGYIEGDRSYYAISLASAMGDRTIISAKSLDPSRNPLTSVMDHQLLEMDQFYPDLNLLRKSVSGGRIALAANKKKSDQKWVVVPDQGSLSDAVHLPNGEVQESPSFRVSVANGEESLRAEWFINGFGKNLYEDTSANKTRVRLEEFSLISSLDQSGQNIYYVKRKSDGRSVPVYVGFLNEPAVFIDENNELSIRGVPRQVSLEDFDIESTFRLNDNTVEQLNKADDEGRNHFDLFEKYFHPWKPLDDTGVYFDAKELDLIVEARNHIKQKKRKSVVLLGEPGVGKSVLVDELLRTLPPTWIIAKLDAASLVSNTKYRGEFETRVEALMTVARTQPVVLLAEGIHTLRNAGSTSEGSSNFFSSLINDISNGNIIFVGTDTAEDFQEAFGNNDTLKNVFDTVRVEKSESDNVFSKLRIKADVMGFRGMTDRVLQTLIQTAAKTLPHLNEPGRSSRVLERLGADEEFVRLMQPGGKNQLSEGEQLKYLRTTFEHMSRLKFSKSELVAFLNEAEKKFRMGIVGTDPVYEKLFLQTRIGWSGLYSGKGPMVRMLLTGSAGVGKSERGIIYAKAMGLPSLYVSPTMANGDIDPNSITEKIADTLEKDPFSVIILDEIEKFNPEFRNLLLNLLSNDILTVTINRRGKKSTRRVYTRFASVLATTNAGEEEIERRFVRPAIGFGGSNSASSELTMSPIELQDILKAELGTYWVDRFPAETAIVRIPKHTKEDLRAIMRLKVAQKIRTARSGNLLGINSYIPDLGLIVDAVLAKTLPKKMNIRNIEGYLNNQIDQIWDQMLRESSHDFDRAKQKKVVRGAACQLLFK